MFWFMCLWSSWYLFIELCIYKDGLFNNLQPLSYFMVNPRAVWSLSSSLKSTGPKQSNIEMCCYRYRYLWQCLQFVSVQMIPVKMKWADCKSLSCSQTWVNEKCLSPPDNLFKKALQWWFRKHLIYALFRIKHHNLTSFLRNHQLEQ